VGAPDSGREAIDGRYHLQSLEARRTTTLKAFTDEFQMHHVEAKEQTATSTKHMLRVIESKLSARVSPQVSRSVWWRRRSR